MPTGLIESFSEEVVRTGPESTLPVNLDDKWLNILSMQMERYFENGADDSLALPLLAVIHILTAKNAGEAVSASHDELFDYLCNYRIEIGLEEVRRKTEMELEPATLENILTNRKVVFKP